MNKSNSSSLLWTLTIYILAASANATPMNKSQEYDVRQSQEADIQKPDHETLITADDELKKLAANHSGNCNAAPDPAKTQYIIGYGSLMQDESRQRTTPNANISYPVKVNGYQRGWFTKGSGVGFSTTFLGVVQRKESVLNAAIYTIDVTEISTMDKREFSYCRLAVEPENYSLLKQDISLSPGQAWIYANKPDTIATANRRYPIVQSYVDIFLSGCLELQQRFELKDFAKQCLVTTSNWSTQWMNDRIYPRRPFIYQPKAGKIDQLLNEHLPQYFQHIRIE
ncbi:MAG: gamma-glutamylcyclotransferase [Pseudomonadota bacterium]|nr:gamma-glutamylcyclotransferase [Pseudomonadota bacterium]